MQKHFSGKRLHTSSYNPLWWVAGFGVLFMLLCAGLWAGSGKVFAPQPVGARETFQLVVHEEEDSLSEEDLALPYNPHKIVLSDTTYERAAFLARKLGANLSFEGKFNFGILTLPRSLTADDVLADEDYAAYRAEMEYDYYTFVSDAPIAWPTGDVSDAYFYFQNAYQFLDLRDTWNHTKGDGITVAVIDTGIDVRSNQFEKLSSLSYNASTQTSVSMQNLNAIMDENGHGTMVAGVLAACDDNEGIIGIAPDITLMVIKANCYSNGSFVSTADLVRGIRYAVDNGADVINMSFSSGGNGFASALRYAAEHGVICVGASGNDGVQSAMYPAADVNCISVGAFSNESYDLASYSNFGHNDICAPGTVYVQKLSGEFDTADGTSFASPIVAGAVALYLSLNPGRERQEVIDRLLNSASDVGDVGCDFYFGCGALDVYRFLFGEEIEVTYHYDLPGVEDKTVVGIQNMPLWTLETPSAENAVFGGWYLDDALSSRLEWYRTVFTADTDLYAEWGTETSVVPYNYVVLSEHAVEIRQYNGTVRNDYVNGLTFPDTIDEKNVVSIGGGALNERGILSVKLPEFLQKIDRYFLGNTQIVLFEDSANNTSYIPSVNNSKLCLYSCRTTEEVFVVNSATRIIFAGAFSGAGALKAVDFGANVISIGDEACANLRTLLSVNFPVSLNYLGNSAFYNCTLLSVNTLPYGVERIEPFTFYNCTSLTSFTVPSSVTSMGEGAFSQCSNMLSVSLPNTLTHIPQAAFYGCSKISAVNLASSRRIDAYAFAGCTMLTVGSLNNFLEHLGAYAFNATRTERIELPERIFVVPIGLFCSDSYLISCDFRGLVQAIGENAFAYCVSLPSFTIPSTVKVLQRAVFKGCTALRRAEFASPYGVGTGDTVFIEIPESMFEDCVSLVRVQMAVADVSIGPAAFSECHELLGITNLHEIIDLGEQAFYNCAKLTGTVILSDDCDEIPDYAFYNCAMLTELILSPYTTHFGEYAFFNCNQLTNAFELESEVENVGKMAFYHCPALQSVTLWQGIGNFESAFRGATGLLELTLPDSVTVIAGQAFDGCSSLQAIEISNTIQHIGQYAFNNCTSLTELYIPNSISLEIHAFNGCTSLEALELPLQGRTLISYFDGNHAPKSLAAVYVNDAAAIAPNAFKDCTHLNCVHLNDEVRSIGAQAFSGCVSLCDILLSESLEHVGRNAFLNVNEEAFSSSGSIYYLGTSENPFYLAVESCNTFAIADNLHADTKLIGEYAFSNWSNLFELKLPRGIMYINDNAFHGCRDLILLVPCGCPDELMASIEGIDSEIYHDYAVTEVEPTLEEEGYTLHECGFCSYAYSSDYVPALMRQPMRLVDAQNILVPGLMHVTRVDEADPEASYFVNIAPGVTLSQLRTCLRVPSAPVAEDAHGHLILDENQPLATGTVLTVYDTDNSVIDRVTVVVKGDVNGDGAISITDLLMVQDVLLELSEPSAPGQKAADVNADGNISITDLLRFVDHLLEVSFIE